MGPLFLNIYPQLYNLLQTTLNLYSRLWISIYFLINIFMCG